MNKDVQVLISIILGIGIFIATLSWMASKEIENNGGIKQIIIDTGKEVKDIIKEIEKD